MRVANLRASGAARVATPRGGGSLQLLGGDGLTAARLARPWRHLQVPVASSAAPDRSSVDEDGIDALVNDAFDVDAFGRPQRPPSAELASEMAEILHLSAEEEEELALSWADSMADDVRDMLDELQSMEMQPIRTKHLLETTANMARATSTVLSPLDGVLDIVGTHALTTAAESISTMSEDAPSASRDGSTQASQGPMGFASELTSTQRAALFFAFSTFMTFASTTAANAISDYVQQHFGNQNTQQDFTNVPSARQSKPGWQSAQAPDLTDDGMRNMMVGVGAAVGAISTKLAGAQGLSNASEFLSNMLESMARSIDEEEAIVMVAAELRRVRLDPDELKEAKSREFRIALGEDSEDEDEEESDDMDGDGAASEGKGKAQ
mmetsp:Transcript_32203/g.96144  ORF Transcript_32203/g.96144 Transcript_32203/m.96144 type:complete len:380 (-) Transcript_32203:587-1726(-)|eukprot:365458-Chlamydomonas_euryale.AAC.11